jgi:hypothetical protein
MRTALRISSLVALLVTVVWVFYKPGFDSVAAAAAALAALLSSFFVKNEEVEPTQKQDVSGKSAGIQAGRDVKVGNINQK